MIYLASPYSDPGAVIRAWRYKRNLAATVRLMEQGMHIWSPVVTGHTLDAAGLKWDHGQWMAWCLTHLQRADKLFVLTIDGWERSKGVGMEVQAAAERRIPVVGCDIIPEAASVPATEILRHFTGSNRAW